MDRKIIVFDVQKPIANKIISGDQGGKFCLHYTSFAFITTLFPIATAVVSVGPGLVRRDSAVDTRAKHQAGA